MPVLDYPEKLLPKANYKIIDIHGIKDSGDFSLARRSLTPMPFNELNILRGEALVADLKDIFGLSLNLLGAEFFPLAIKYIPKIHSPANEEWREGDEVKELDELLPHIEENEKAEPIYFLIKDVAPHQFPFAKKYDKTSIKKIPEHLALEINQEKFTVTYNSASSIEHKPIQANYWHVEFLVHDCSQNEGKEIRKKIVKGSPPEGEVSDDAHWTTIVAHHYFHLFKAKAKPSLSSTRPISKEHYEKSA